MDGPRIAHPPTPRQKEEVHLVGADYGSVETRIGQLRDIALRLNSFDAVVKLLQPKAVFSPKATFPRMRSALGSWTATRFAAAGSRHGQYLSNSRTIPGRK
ncbi:predicted protein [Histoplasma capsulatum G186AR]|uniref:Uncharacterized protein n=1 Tax=Ajellomyces capsulatus (strain G186AR / H82 / ATCC MYA-2454 / RMSCC 2432) TaxID=447093 RepID=C0NGP5_AJECG|nr:uncharacterized protein HCBG_02517 [Histoplasma capsulatum G186AR]EEH08980.1 predicted protein [Histoplasma capsulatum G186AR]